MSSLLRVTGQGFPHRASQITESDSVSQAVKVGSVVCGSAKLERKGLMGGGISQKGCMEGSSPARPRRPGVWRIYDTMAT